MNEAMRINTLSLPYVPDHLKTQEMCKRAVEKDPYTLKFVPDHFKTQEMCKKVAEEYPWWLKDVPDHLKTREMCERAVEDDPWSLKFVPDWFVMQELIKIWHDHCGDDGKLIEWYEGYKKRKDQKAQIKKELMRIAWHPSRWWDWCVPEDQKKETVKLWV